MSNSKAECITIYKTYHYNEGSSCMASWIAYTTIYTFSYYLQIFILIVNTSHVQKASLPS